MRQYLQRHKKTILLIFLTLIITLGVIILVRSRSQMTKQENKMQEITFNYKSITPGATSKESVMSIIGDPLDQNQNNNQTTYTFTSPVEARPHEAVFEGSELLLFKETVNLNKTAKDIKDKFGDAPNMLYRSTVAGGFALYIYPDRGVAYLGDTSGKNIITEIWYFKPTTFENFKTKWAPDFYDSVATEGSPAEGAYY